MSLKKHKEHVMKHITDIIITRVLGTDSGGKSCASYTNSFVLVSQGKGRG